MCPLRNVTYVSGRSIKIRVSATLFGVIIFPYTGWSRAGLSRAGAVRL